MFKGVKFGITDRLCQTYFKMAELYIYFKNNPIENVHLIQYEDMFDDNYKNLKEMLNKIGFKYENNIFNNAKFKNQARENYPLKDYKPSNQQHMGYRTWQINQPFVNNNDKKGAYDKNEKYVKRPSTRKRKPKKYLD